MWKNAFSVHADICCSIFEKTKTIVTKRCYNQLKTEPNFFSCIPHTSSKHQSHFWSSSRLFVLQAVVIELQTPAYIVVLDLKCFFGVLQVIVTEVLVQCFVVFLWLNRALLGISPNLSTTAFGSKKKTSTTENNCATADFTTALFYSLYNKQNPPI